MVKDFRALQSWRRDLFTPSSLAITYWIVDAAAESHGFARFVADATDAFFRAAEDEDISGECHPEFKDQLAAEGEDTDVLFKFVKSLMWLKNEQAEVLRDCVSKACATVRER